MTRLILPALIAFVLVPSEELATQYTPERVLRSEVTSQFHMETVSFSMERDGEPMEGGFGGGPTTDEARVITMIDTVIAADEGVPTHVRREFETVSSKTTMMMRDEERESERDCPLDGVTIDMLENDGDVVVEVVEGSEPDDDSVLEGHALGLALDALLPQDDVEAGDSWTIEAGDLARALGFDLERALFPRPAREEGGGERGGRRGRRFGRGGGSQSAARFFSLGEWEVEATLGDETEEYEGQDCYVITIEGEASGEVPERERGGGRDRDRTERALSASAPRGLRPESSFEADIEAKLYIRVDGRHPVHFELEGEFGLESLREMEHGGSSMSIASVQEGLLKYSVDISRAPADSDE